MPDRMPEDMPEDMPEHMPEDMPDRMPEDMSDRMPEDLPVRKCINVMVGITRSKVIVFIPCAGPFITAFFFSRGPLRSLFARLVGCLGAQNLCSSSCGFELGEMQDFSAYEWICADLYGPEMPRIS